ncbi:20525_t:CDS:2 [Funneliformis geosporum]|nr:20525_t:CDS:2 [Funneliformis geosporum]
MSSGQNSDDNQNFSHNISLLSSSFIQKSFHIFNSKDLLEKPNTHYFKRSKDTLKIFKKLQNGIEKILIKDCDFIQKLATKS